MGAENKGLVKAIFRQGTSPTPIDVLWYDTGNNVLKYFNLSLLSWTPLFRSTLTGILTPNTPTGAEITSLVGLTAVQVGAGFQVSIFNTNDNVLYFIESDGTDWHYYRATEVSLLKDLDGNIYHSVTIGTQIWLIENLRVTKYADGSPIPNLTIESEWSADTLGAYCWYNNDIANKTVRGAMYNWHSVNNVKGLAYITKDGVNQNYRIPSKADFVILSSFLGGDTIAGGKIKEVGLVNWAAPNYATDIFGFKAVPGGRRAGGFFFYTQVNDFWTSDWATTGFAWMRELQNDQTRMLESYLNKYHGLSVRLVKDV